MKINNQKIIQKLKQEIDINYYQIKVTEKQKMNQKNYMKEEGGEMIDIKLREKITSIKRELKKEKSMKK